MFIRALKHDGFNEEEQVYFTCINWRWLRVLCIPLCWSVDQVSLSLAQSSLYGTVYVQLFKRGFSSHGKCYSLTQLFIKAVDHHFSLNHCCFSCETGADIVLRRKHARQLLIILYNHLVFRSLLSLFLLFFFFLFFWGGGPFSDYLSDVSFFKCQYSPFPVKG